MSSADSHPIPGHAHSEYSSRQILHSDIRAGVLPTVEDLLCGAPWLEDDLRKDLAAWCTHMLLSKGVLAAFQKALDELEPGVKLRPLIQNMKRVRTVGAIKLVEQALDRLADDDAVRMLCYRAAMDDDEARTALVDRAVKASWSRSGYEQLWLDATIYGLTHVSRSSMYHYCDVGLHHFKRYGRDFGHYEGAERAAKAGKGALKKLEKSGSFSLEDIMIGQADDTDGILPPPADDEEPAGPSMIVVPSLPEGTGHRREIAKAWKDIDGEALPIVTRGDIAAHRRSLVERWPHAVEIIDIILGDLAAVEQVRFRPTLLVGKPGSGKSSLARAICEQVGLPVQLYSVPSAADGSLAGTSAQWSTAREAIPLQLIRQAKMASVAVVWDEIEKAPEGRHNGSPSDSLLPMLEIDQARCFRDLALEVECDLSMVSHFATANSTDTIPAPIRDRMRILHMPEPGWQHLGVLTGQIIGRLAAERGVDRRWYVPLAEDEIDLVKQAWPGGSMRQLTRIVSTIVDGREAIMGRC